MMDYRLNLYTPPTAWPVSFAEAKTFCKSDDDDVEEDALIAGFIPTATEMAENFTGRALITQTLEMKLDGFPGCAISLPKPKLQSVTHIKYIDPDGTEQTWDDENYTVDGSDSDFGRIVPAYQGIFPSTRNHIDVVTIRFVAGYGDAPANVPEPIRLAIMYLVRHWYDNRENIAFGGNVSEVPFTTNALLWPYRMVQFG